MILQSNHLNLATHQHVIVVGVQYVIFSRFPFRPTRTGEDFRQSNSRIGASYAFDSLGLIDQSGEGDSQQAGKERVWTAAALPAVAWCVGFDCSKESELPRGGRSNRTLCPRPIPLRFDGFGLVHRPCNHFRFRQDARQMLIG